MTASQHAERLNKLRFRAWRRGFREADLILGPFADKHVGEFDDRQLNIFERLLDADDQYLYGWIIGREPTPPEYQSDVMDLLSAFGVVQGGAIIQGLLHTPRQDG
jgi:antitoxin CptB